MMFRTTAAARSALRRRRLPPSIAQGGGSLSEHTSLGIRLPSNDPPAARATCVDPLAATPPAHGRNFWHPASSAPPDAAAAGGAADAAGVGNRMSAPRLNTHDMCAGTPSISVRSYASTASTTAEEESAGSGGGGTLRRPRPKREDQQDTRSPQSSAAAAAATSSTSSDATSDEDRTDELPSPSQEFDEILSSDDYDPQTAVDDIFVASRWNQGLGPSGEWDPAFVLAALDNYERHLRYVLHKLSTTADASAGTKSSSSTAKPSSSTSASEDSGDDEEEEEKEEDDEEFQSIAERIDPDPQKIRATKWLLSSNTVSRAFRSLTRSNLETYDMGRRVRGVEKLVGSIGLTPLTDLLSQNLLEANGKAGNVGRALSLLSLRKSRHYAPNAYEFEHAIQSIESAGLYLRKSRNVFLGEKGQPPLDNPTRWLDAILLNMSSRGVQLDIDAANRMLDCYASMGRSGKAIHFFYDVVRDFVEDDGTYYPMRDVEGGDRHHRPQEFEGKQIPEHVLRDMPTFYNRKIKVRMRMRDPPPYHKVPSRVKGSLVKRFGDEEGGGITKLQQESEKSWSPALTAAFAFADSLTHGACGHQAIELNKKSWNILIAACCNRGAIWRAMQIAEETMPNNGFEPDIYTYNTILGALSRLGDVPTMREYMVKLTNAGIKPHQFTVDFLVSGHLNSGDIGGAVSIVQDMFNQHSVLPPYTTHLKIIEFALANDLVYEAKRHVYFLQQLWKWKPNDSVDPKFRTMMYLTTRNPNLNKNALKKLFRYFGEELADDDFF